MKKLYLVRHAKSSWADAKLTDFERPLNERGNRDKIEMGKRLFERELTIDYILSSSAKRTQQTSVALAKEVQFPIQNIIFEERLYHASVQEMLALINEMNKEINNLMIVGHNPGISMLCDYLCDYHSDFPTLGIACIHFEVESWQEVSRNLGSLAWYDYPKNK